MEDSGFNKIIQNINEQRDPNQQLWSYEKSLELAKELLEKYKDKINENRQKDVDGFDNGEVYSDFQKSIVHYLSETLSEDMKEHYYGHGITRGYDDEKLASFISIAKNKLIKGEYAKLSESGYGHAFVNRADFFVLSKKDTRLDVVKKNPETDREEPEMVKVEGEYAGWKADVGALVVDVKFYPLLDELKMMFPDVNIIRANELPNYLT